MRLVYAGAGMTPSLSTPSGAKAMYLQTPLAASLIGRGAMIDRNK